MALEHQGPGLVQDWLGRKAAYRVTAKPLKKMRELHLDTATANDDDKAVDTPEHSVSTPFSATSYASVSRHTDSCSDRGTDAVQPEDECPIKSENTPPETPLETRNGTGTPATATKRTKHRVQRDRPSTDEARRIRVNERSKTGCITCRKRKKKCDETKPFCQNCSKTNYKCEGYVSRRDWKPTGRRGSSKSEEEAILLRLPQQQSLPALPAIENEIDAKFFKHYIEKTSQILSINTEDESNPWTDLILPLAKDDQGLMHFVLALAGAHWKGAQEDRTLQARQIYHDAEAIKILRQRLRDSKPRAADSEPVAASMILHLLMSKSGIASAQPHGCLQALREFLQEPDTDFWRFAQDFYTQYKFSTNLTSLPERGSRRALERLEEGPGSRAWPSTGNGAPRLAFGVLAGIVDLPFMTLISKITELRDKIRERQQTSQTPMVHYTMLADAGEVGRQIDAWQSAQTEGTARYVAAELYRHASRLYLLRTVRSVQRPESRRAFGRCVGFGLECLEVLPSDDPVQAGILLPTFILGCGALEQDHRNRIGYALDRIESYSGFGNVRPVREILDRVWHMMASADDRSWDWESIMHDMGYGTLVA